MNILEFAKDRERQAEDLYHQLADMHISEGMTTIFQWLAEAEKRHYEIIRKMAKGETVELSHPDILVFAQSTIHQMKSGKERFTTATSQVEVYKTAEAMEKESETFYRENAGKMKEGYDRQVFLALAKEERQHLTLLENIVEFITFPSNNPVDAEFNTPVENG